jgi:hypothetical protein
MNKDIFWIAPIAAMGIGLFPMPYGYYFLSRLVVFVCAIYFAMQLNDQSDTTWVWIFGFLALLYNPFIPIHLGSKGLWIIVNIATVALFLFKKDKI